MKFKSYPKSTKKDAFEQNRAASVYGYCEADMCISFTLYPVWLFKFKQYYL